MEDIKDDDEYLNLSFISTIFFFKNTFHGFKSGR